MASKGPRGSIRQHLRTRGMLPVGLQLMQASDVVVVDGLCIAAVKSDEEGDLGVGVLATASNVRLRRVAIGGAQGECLAAFRSQVDLDDGYLVRCTHASVLAAAQSRVSINATFVGRAGWGSPNIRIEAGASVSVRQSYLDGDGEGERSQPAVMCDAGAVFVPGDDVQGAGDAPSCSQPQ